MKNKEHVNKNVALIVLSAIVIGIFGFKGYSFYNSYFHHRVPESFRVSLRGDYTDSNGSDDVDATRYFSINKDNIVEKQKTIDEDANNKIVYKIDSIDRLSKNKADFNTHQKGTNYKRTFEINRISKNNFKIVSDGITTKVKNGIFSIDYDVNSSKQQAVSYVRDILMGVSLDVNGSYHNKVTLMKNKDNGKYTFPMDYTDDYSDQSTDMGDAYIIKVENKKYYNYVYIFKNIGEDDTDIAPDIIANVVYGSPAGRDNNLYYSADDIDDNHNMSNGPIISYNN